MIVRPTEHHPVVCSGVPAWCAEIARRKESKDDAHFEHLHMIAEIRRNQQHRRFKKSDSMDTEMLDMDMDKMKPELSRLARIFGADGVDLETASERGTPAAVIETEQRFSDVLSAAVKHSRKSNTMLAELTGSYPSQISLWTTGKRLPPSEDKVRSLAIATGTDEDMLVEAYRKQLKKTEKYSWRGN